MRVQMSVKAINVKIIYSVQCLLLNNMILRSQNEYNCLIEQFFQPTMFNANIVLRISIFVEGCFFSKDTKNVTWGYFNGLNYAQW